MIIGNLNKELKGKVSTLETTFALKLIPNSNMKDEKSPTHTVTAVNRSGEVFQIGCSWERTISKGDKINQKMYSIAIDDPAFKSPLNCSAFPTDEGFNIVWERQEPVRDNF